LPHQRGRPPRDDRPVPGPARRHPRHLDSIKTRTTRSSYAGALARLVSRAGGRDTASPLPEDYAGALAAYTVCRQILFRYREEPRKSRFGCRASLIAAGLVLIADVIVAIVV
jgi:hypothetical protein